jgi:hypothetical protein
MVAIAFSGVDQINAQVAGFVENAVDNGLIEIDAPLAAILPGADADDGDAEICFAEGAVFHMREYTPRVARES